ncbi:MAG: hypothetical protein EPO51_06035 [Phenylobacterium sp.]|uniref:hypothetical protein n=1 Tax=Phenylobacterium sp. TaxID=1871053 RepID=UPI0012203990|nr:hypothetical protein [Phenylobacterium sp.]TAJ73193.1 MAG: hypothetical protein EPO51_06035 [Phenylobacterium sp.]
MDRPRKSRLRLAARLWLVGGLVAPAWAHAQGLSADQLLSRGDQAYGSNCVRASKYYYALIQKFPERLDAQGTGRLQGLIAGCERYPLGAPGNDAKFDDTTGRAAACIAYGEVAVAEARAASSMARCRTDGPRWSTSMAEHVNWCMAPDVSRAQVRSERDERRKHLDQCAFK